MSRARARPATLHDTLRAAREQETARCARALRGALSVDNALLLSSNALAAHGGRGPARAQQR
eukprot:9735002-Lingulodinium_polyedra.AAC.1